MIDFLRQHAQDGFDRIRDVGAVAVTVTQFHRLSLGTSQGQALPNTLGQRVTSTDKAARESNPPSLNDFDRRLASTKIDQCHWRRRGQGSPGQIAVELTTDLPVNHLWF